jgi:hypothetical protein
MDDKRYSEILKTVIEAQATHIEKLQALVLELRSDLEKAKRLPPRNSVVYHFED